MSQNAGGGGGGVRLSQWVQPYTGAQVNFGDLTPYLTYDVQRQSLYGTSSSSLWQSYADRHSHTSESIARVGIYSAPLV